MKFLDFGKEGKRYYFRLQSGEEFWDAVRAVKRTFKPQEREYDDDTKEWSVPANDRNEAKLRAIFENADACIVRVKAQLRMF